MITDEQKQLCEDSAKLMGYHRHESGEEWPKLPFYFVGKDGLTGIRWNDRDVSFIDKKDPSGRLDKSEITEYWIPTHKVEQAMLLWKGYPPQTQWLQVQVGKDGWIVELLYHYNKETKKGFSTDDDKSPSLATAITEAWIAAMTQQIKDLPTT